MGRIYIFGVPWVGKREKKLNLWGDMAPSKTNVAPPLGYDSCPHIKASFGL